MKEDLFITKIGHRNKKTNTVGVNIPMVIKNKLELTTDNKLLWKVTEDDEGNIDISISKIWKLFKFENFLKTFIFQNFLKMKTFSKTKNFLNFQMKTFPFKKIVF